MANKEPIAIVGYAYRAPGVGRKPLWDFLAEGRSAWSRVPAERFDQDAYHSSDRDKAGTFAPAGAHFLPDDVYAFDAAFFNIRQDEARAMDPQHRLVLETAFEAAENAGITIGELAGANVGVFAANESSEYYAQSLDDLPTTSKYTATATAACMFANRLSYFLDLKGPSISVDAACASSSSALHMACQSVRSGECKAAFVGAASLILNPMMLCAFDTMGALSPEGKCFSYDMKASGFGRGEGAAALIIKPLRDAIEHGDPIHAIVGNTACSHGGRTDGITVPSKSAQRQLLLRVHQEVGWDPNDTTVVEGHGTGTRVGDPIEVNAIADVIASKRSALDPIYLGSVKSNFGHTESTSGLLAVIKSILMLQQGYILPTANFEKLNPAITACDKLRILKKPSPWPSGRPRRICISNFGFGGSNAAILLEQYSPSSDQARYVAGGRARRIFLFSAKNESSLRAYLAAFRDYLAATPDSSIDAQHLSYTLGQRRTHFPYRMAISADSVQELANKIATGPSSGNFSRAKTTNILFVFTGQGAQVARMATGLQRWHVFTDNIRRAEQYLTNFGASWSLQAELNKPESESRVNEAVISQPACTAVQLALVELLRQWKVTPAIVTGHSSGEIAAAYAAGLLSFEGAMAIAYFRGQAAAEAARSQPIKGGMLALGASAERASQLISEAGPGYAAVAAINSPESVTVSGDASTIDNVEAVAKAKGIFARKLKVDIAYHSKHLDRVSTSYLAAIQEYCFKGSRSSISTEATKFVSSVTGQVEDSIDASYWVKNLLQPVRLLDAMQTVFTSASDSPNTIIEIGPHAALKGPNKQTLDSLLLDTERPYPTYIATLSRGANDEEMLLDAASRLHMLGAELDFSTINLTTHSNARVLTDLPRYEWHKSERYIHESRIAQQKQHPGVPYHHFLGWKSPYDEGDQHSFRQVFTLDEMPWLRGHNIAGEVIFPMTGYVALGVAAVRAICRKLSPTIVVREFHAKRSLTIEEDQSVDITTKLSPMVVGTSSSSDTTWSFEVLSWSLSRGWTSHCHGLLDASSSKASMKSPAINVAAKLAKGIDHLTELDADNEYLAFADSGLRYGPAFKNMTKVWVGDHIAIHEVKLRQMDLAADAATLDSMFHSLGLIQASDAHRSTFVPHYFRQFRVLGQLPLDHPDSLTVVTRSVSADAKLGSFVVSIVVFAQLHETLVPVCEFEQLTSRSIATTASVVNESECTDQPESYDWSWEPYLDLATSGQIREALALEPVQRNELEHRRHLNEAAIHFMTKALETTRKDDQSRLPPHLVRFRAWAERVVASHNTNAEDTMFLIDSVRSSDAQGEMLCAVGENLVLILQGKVQPLEIMLRDGLLSRNYVEDISGKRSNNAVAKYIGNLAKVQTDLRILEIGGGTASATQGILEQLSTNTGPRSFNYVFTDISSGFFADAQEKLSRWSDRIDFHKLDISKDPEAQGFSLQSFDIIVAGNVLHATPDIATTIDHVRSLLRVGGKLVLLECMNHPPLNLPFALLPGWWNTNDEYRTDDGPMLSASAWNFLLSERGFSGTDLVLDDYPETDARFMSILSSTKISKPEKRGNGMVVVHGTFSPADEREVAQQLADHFHESFGSVSLRHYMDQMPANKPCIFVDSRHHSVLADVTSRSFQALKELLLKSSGVLWVVPQGSGPRARTIKGILRTLRLECSEKYFLLLEDVPILEGASTIAKVAERLLEATPTNLTEQEFLWSQDMIRVPRLRPTPAAKQAFAQKSAQSIKSQQRVHSGRNECDTLEMTVDSVGSLDSIYFRRCDLSHEQLGEDEVVIQVQAAGVNFRDLLLVLGSMPWHAPGLEGAGVITRVGHNVKSLQPGDRVFYASMQAGFATYVRIPALCAYKLPAGLDIADAATMPVAYSTALWCLMRVAQIRPGETLLVHAATGAVGQALITIAKNFGAVIFATAGTPEKRKFLHDTFGIPVDRIYSSRTPDFHDEILCATNGKGVDVVVNSLSGQLLERTFDIIADFGRFVEIGKKDFLQNNYLAMRPFDRNVTFSGVDLRHVFLNRPAAVQECLSEIAALLDTGIISPIQPVTKIPVSNVEGALRKLQTGQNIGKVVLTVASGDTVLGEPPQHLCQYNGKLLHPNATYVVTGGTGGIGRSLAPWLFENGATSVVLLGRSGSTNPDVARLVQQYHAPGVQLRAFACDVGSREDMINFYNAIHDLPPVRGVIHGALYLRDSLFENAEYEDWYKITSPKIQAAWHLHELFPGLDFFISLASVTGVTGHAGQSIYAGTTSFLDAFTAYRRKQGLAATSIILPVIEDAGYVKDRNLSDPLKKTLGVWLNTEQLFTIIKDAILDSAFGLCDDGKAMTFIRGASSILPWERFNMLAALRQKSLEEATDKATSTGANAPGAEGPSFLEALMSRVCTLTMMEKDEVTPDRPLNDYGLDSLVSVELRNWIKRESGIEIALNQILSTPNLQMLAESIAAQQQGK